MAVSRGHFSTNIPALFLERETVSGWLQLPIGNVVEEKVDITADGQTKNVFAGG